MFNKKRGSVLYYALGIAGAVIVAAGTGTYLFITQRKTKRTRDMAAQAKRVVHRATATTKRTAKHTNHHPASR
jgi:hypothetical protein